MTVDKILTFTGKEVNTIKFDCCNLSTTYITPIELLRIVKAFPDKILDANMRKPKYNNVVENILSTLTVFPKAYAGYTNGITIVVKDCLFDFSKKTMVLNFNSDVNATSGIIDGGHNLFAILTYLYQATKSKTRKKITFWDELLFRINFSEIEAHLMSLDQSNLFSIPIRLYYSNKQNESAWSSFYQKLKETKNTCTEVSVYTKYNDKNYYDAIKSVLNASLNNRIIWKENDSLDKDIESYDIISLLSIPLSKHPKYDKAYAGNLASYKRKLVEYYVSFIEDEDNALGEWRNNSFRITDRALLSAINILPALIELSDTIETDFIALYNRPDNSRNFRDLPSQVGFASKRKRRSLPLTPDPANPGKTFFLRKNMPSTYSSEVPRAFILIVLAGFSKLLKYNEEQSLIYWRTDPLLFWNQNKQKIIDYFAETIYTKATTKTVAHVGGTKEAYNKLGTQVDQLI